MCNAYVFPTPRIWMKMKIRFRPEYDKFILFEKVRIVAKPTIHEKARNSSSVHSFNKSWPFPNYTALDHDVPNF